MTDREKFIVMAYTGVSMLDFDKFHEQVEELMGRPVYSHEFALDLFTDELKEKVKPEFLKLCSQHNSWTKFDPDDRFTWPEEESERATETVLVCDREGDIYVGYIWGLNNINNRAEWSLTNDVSDVCVPLHCVTAWMPLPEPYKEETS